MKLKFANLLLVLAVFAMAGCATNNPSGWGFRYEDRDKIAESAAKIETVAIRLQELARRPDSYLPDVNMTMNANSKTNMERSYNTRAADRISFFAGEAGRFHRAVVAWQPDGKIGLEYSNLIRQWELLQNASAKLSYSEDMRTKLMSINTMVMNLSRFTNQMKHP